MDIADFKSNYFEINRLTKFINSEEIELCSIKVYNKLYYDKNFIASAIALIYKIDKGFYVKDLSKEESELFKIVQDLYDISDDENFIKYPIIKVLKKILSKDMFEFFFDTNGQLDKDTISRLGSLNDINKE